MLPRIFLSKRAISFFLSLVLIVPVNGQLNTGSPVDQKIYQDNILALLKENNVPAVGIGIIRNGKLRQVSVYGELTKNVAAPYNTIFNVASLTKPVVTMLTLKLVSMGKWNLDEPLSNYWVDPEIANDPRHKKITTRIVLSHQTGFVNWRWLHATKKLAIDFEPGTKFQYSGEGFEYLRKALENRFNKTLDQLTDSLIFSPLGMKDTRQYWDKNMDESRFALWHDKEGNNTYTDHKKTPVSAADDLLTTIEDYGKFGVSVMYKTGLTDIVFNDMIKPQSTMKEGHHMGLGWELIENLSNNEYALIHSGADRGVKTLVLLLPKSGQGLVIMTNGDNGVKLYEKIITNSLDLGKEIMKHAN
ncbi:MAG: serine hydrolase domain-containing protein [Chitinophagaceae bacterium]